MYNLFIMAKRYFCDRCDRQVDGEEDLKQAVIPSTSFWGNSIPQKTPELCAYCLNDLHEVLRNYAKAPPDSIVPSPEPVPGHVEADLGLVFVEDVDNDVNF